MKKYNLFSSATLTLVLYLSIGFSSPARKRLTIQPIQPCQRSQPVNMKESIESRKIVELSKRLSTRATTSMRQIMQTRSTLPVSIVILPTRT